MHERERMADHSLKQAVVSLPPGFLSLAGENMIDLDIPAATWPCIPGGLHALGRFNPVIPVYVPI
jgi:hypothetical protein